MVGTNNVWQSAAETALGQEITSKKSLSGGDFATAYAAKLADGTRVFVKTHADPPAYFFSTEATGLTWLSETKTVHIPKVLAVNDDPPFLALEWVDIGNGSASSDDELGASLAELHRIEQSSFGRTDERTTGSLGVPNKMLSSWAEFYATQRLQPLADLALRRHAIPEADCEALLEIADHLSAAVIAEDSPSLLHGDLWAGNRITDTTGQSWLVDPAAHCGHREFDLSMMLLFGGYSEQCFEAYQKVYPLQPGFMQRVPLHQLAPLVVHAIKFGDSYLSAVSSAIAASRKLLR